MGYMQTRSPKYRAPSLLYGDLLEQINPKHPLVILLKKFRGKNLIKHLQVNMVNVDVQLNLLD